VHLVCTRRGGDVAATSEGGSTFTARLPAGPALVDA
jgi:two-component system CitB family sensor kinase